jgi:hypothetical protein
LVTPANHLVTPANHLATPANHLATPANHLATPANYLATPTKRLVKQPELRVLTENGYFYPFLCMNGLSIQYRMGIRVGVVWREA